MNETRTANHTTATALRWNTAFPFAGGRILAFLEPTTRHGKRVGEAIAIRFYPLESMDKGDQTLIDEARANFPTWYTSTNL